MKKKLFFSICLKIIWNRFQFIFIFKKMFLKYYYYIRNSGQARLVLESDQLNVSDIIGRSVVVYEKEDDFGLSANEQVRIEKKKNRNCAFFFVRIVKCEKKPKQSKIDGNAGERIACAVVARSAGVQQVVFCCFFCEFKRFLLNNLFFFSFIECKKNLCLWWHYDLGVEKSRRIN